MLSGIRISCPNFISRTNTNLDIFFFLIDNFFLEMCEKVKYCVTKEIDKGTEYVIRLGNQTYVMIYGD